MSQTTPGAAASEQPKKISAAEAAKQVRRVVIEYVDGKDAGGAPAKVPREKKVAVSASEVLDYADHGTHVVVVTTDGQKFSSLDA